MSVAALAWPSAAALLAAVAGARLLRASSRREARVRNGYRWLAIAAACVGAGAVVQGLFGGLIGGAQPLRVADLVGMAALPAMVIGLATLTAEAPGAAEAPGPAGLGQAWRVLAGRGRGRSAPGLALDCCLLVASLFVICFVTMFGPDYLGAGLSPAAFAVDLIRPLADLAALGLLLRFVERSPGLALLPALAVAAFTLSDCLAIRNRAGGSAPGAAAELTLLAGLGVLAMAGTGLTGARAGGGGAGAAAVRPDRDAGSLPSPATLAALAAAAAAALVVTGFSVGGLRVASPALAIGGALVVLLLVLRLVGFARQESAVVASAAESDRMFRALADSAVDAVLVCDLAGTIEYASPAIGDYGYVPGQVVGRRLTDLVHSQDIPSGLRAAARALRAPARPGEAGGGKGTATFAGRVRGADGSWRHVESSLSRYGQPGEPARLLVTARDVSDRMELRRQVAHLTFHDGLTGLPNRAYLEERLRELCRAPDGAPDGVPDGAGKPSGPGSGPAVAAILLDLDGYAAVNDLLGHSGGDLLLAQAGRRLRAAAPPEAAVARWGSDEFAVLVGGKAGASGIVDLAERLVGQISSEPFAVAGKEISLTASAGVARGGTGPDDRAGQVLGSAHAAMVRAKEAGGGRVEVFAPAMHAQARRRGELAASLGRAIAAARIEVEYLPIAELATSRVTGVEALARLPLEGRLVPAREFLGVAEDTGQVVELGGMLLRAACRQVAAWRSGGWEVGLAVRFSVRQVCAPRFAASLLAVLGETGLPPQALTAEVTEGVLIGGPGPILTDLTRLRGQGVRLAIADFGTGRASLAHLPHLGVDIIKVAPSFVAGLGADPALALLTKAVVHLGHDLGIDVIAEGVERPDQAELLVSMGCRLGQGCGTGSPATPAGLSVPGLPVPWLPVPWLPVPELSVPGLIVPGGWSSDPACGQVR